MLVERVEFKVLVEMVVMDLLVLEKVEMVRLDHQDWVYNMELLLTKLLFQSHQVELYDVASVVAVEEVVVMTTTINPKKLHLELVVAVVLESLLEKEEKKVPVVEEAKVMKEVVLTGLRVKKEVQMQEEVVVLNLSQAKKRPEVVKVAMEEIKKMLTQKMEKKVKVVKDLVEQVEQVALV